MSKQQVKALPLAGKQVLVTRTQKQAGALSERLQDLGAIPVVFPSIRIVPPQDWQALDTVLNRLFLARDLPYYAWLVFTSANGVHIFCERLLSLGYSPQFLSGVRVAAIGPATAAALAHYGLATDIVPDVYIAEGVAAALIEDARRGGESLQGKRVLLPRAAEARKILVTELRQAGALVDEVAAYSTEAADGGDEQGNKVLRLLQSGQIDILTFTSSSTVRHFMQWLESCEGSETGSFTNIITHNLQLKIACIGQITARTARDSGLTVAIEAKEFTIDGLVEAIVQSEG